MITTDPIFVIFLHRHNSWLNFSEPKRMMNEDGNSLSCDIDVDDHPYLDPETVLHLCDDPAHLQDPPHVRLHPRL